MSAWYFPTESGDIRLEAYDGGTRLSVVDPTPRELWAIRRLLDVAQARGWARPGEVQQQQCIQLACTVDAAGRALLGWDRTTPGVISAVRYVDGRVEATLDGIDETAVPLDAPTALPAGEPPATEAATEAIEQVVPGEGTAELLPQKKGKKNARRTAVAKATMPRPTLCCPRPWPGPLDRASEVLRQFCTEAEWAEWSADAMIHVRGSYTGHLYRVVHRHHPLAHRQGKIAWDETSDHVVHCHLSTLPPPEEVLSVMLTLKWGEDWIRNPSGYFGPGPRFAHPAGLGATEGVASAAGLIQFGVWAQLMAPLVARSGAV